MTGKSKEKELVNSWILNELAILQQDYFSHLEKKEINFATAKLIKFTREKFSNEYLELIKIFPWDSNTKNTVLFVYQQLLIMLHPAIPFITEHIYQEITQQEILNEKIEKIEIKTEKNDLWQIDCLLLLISNIRNFQKKSKVGEFYLEMVPEWKDKLDVAFDFNQFLEPLTGSRISILEKKKNNEFSSFLDLPPFGVLWYHEQVDKQELEKKLNFYETEYQIISKRWLENHNFLAHASPQLVEEKKRKLGYYQAQKKKIQAELEKLLKLN